MDVFRRGPCPDFDLGIPQAHRLGGNGPKRRHQRRLYPQGPWLAEKGGYRQQPPGDRRVFPAGPPERITLLRVYQAVTEQSRRRLLDIHQNANDACIVGRHIEPVLTGMFAQAESAFTRALSEQTPAQCAADIRSRL